MGLDVSEHGMWGYPEFYIPVPGGYGTEHDAHGLDRTARGARRQPRRPRRRRAPASPRRRGGGRLARPPPRRRVYASAKVTVTLRGRLLRARPRSACRRRSRAAFANIGTGAAPPLSTTEVTLPSERPGGGGERLGAQARVGHRRLQRLAVELALRRRPTSTGRSPGSRPPRRRRRSARPARSSVDRRGDDVRGREARRLAVLAERPARATPTASPTSRPPAALTAAITWRISRAFAASAALAVAARVVDAEREHRGRRAPRRPSRCRRR